MNVLFQQTRQNADLSYMSMSFSYLECTNPQPLGIEDGNISDSQLDSSSIPTLTSGPERARLNMPAGG